jgi:hypothetical protein
LETDSWERPAGETNPAWNAFCRYRDYGPDRSVKRVLDLQGIPLSRFGIWCKWSAKYAWVRRAGDYDVYLDRLKRSEREKIFAERETLYREITGKILDSVKQRLEGFDPEELGPGNVVEWLKSGIEVEREIFGKGKDRESDVYRQLEINFTHEFDGI